MGGREAGGLEVCPAGAETVMAGGSLPTWFMVGGLTPTQTKMEQNRKKLISTFNSKFTSS